MQNTAKTLINQYYEAFNQRDMNRFANLLADDVIHDINQGETQHGKAAFMKFMAHMNECYQEKVKDLIIMSNEQQDHAAAQFIVEGIYLNTDGELPPAHGQKYRLTVGCFFEIKDNKIHRVSLFYNLKDWLAQISD